MGGQRKKEVSGMFWDGMDEADYWENEILARQEEEGGFDA